MYSDNTPLKDRETYELSVYLYLARDKAQHLQEKIHQITKMIKDDPENKELKQKKSEFVNAHRDTIELFGFYRDEIERRGSLLFRNSQTGLKPNTKKLKKL